MNRVVTELEGVFVLEPDVFIDDRGFFLESWNAATLTATIGMSVDFVQDNHSRSAKGVIRGLHYQLPNPQAKLLRCVSGAVWDVAVDIRRASPTFRRWVGVELTADNKRQLWVPEGFAHGFLALTDNADLLYKVTSAFEPSSDRAIRWDDPELGIEWPIDGSPMLSGKDAAAPMLSDVVLFD